MADMMVACQQCLGCHRRAGPQREPGGRGSGDGVGGGGQAFTTTLGRLEAPNIRADICTHVRIRGGGEGGGQILGRRVHAHAPRGASGTDTQKRSRGAPRGTDAYD